MSVLNLPRFVFSGYTDWNPNTVNNSSTIYDEVTAEPVPQPGVAWEQFVAWLLESNTSTNPAGLQPNGSWNVFGDHGVAFMTDAGNGAKITGISLAVGSARSDPLIGASVQLSGLSYSDSATPPPARLIDVEPYGPFSSQIFYENLIIGNATVGVKGPGACRMFSRWPNFGRNLGTLPIAGGMGVIWQTAASNASLQWKGVDQSPALAALQAAATSGGNQGIVLQFASYRTLYYQTVTYQGRPIRSGGDLIWAYQNGYKGSNPARSILVGTIGVWGPGELASAPTQRLLAPNVPVTKSSNLKSMVRLDSHPEAALTAVPTPVPLGPAVAFVDQSRNVVTVDFLATFPEQGGTLTKANLGTFLLQAIAADGSVTQIGSPLAPEMYAQTAYESAGGILDFDFQPTQLSAITSGSLQLVQENSTAGPDLLESQFLVETDQRASYIDEGETKSISIRVYQNGATPALSVQLLASQYDSGGNLIAAPTNQIVTFTGTSASGVLTVTGGAAQLTFRATQAGVCYIFFLPFTGSAPPIPPVSGFGSSSDFFAVIRALPFDNELEASTPDSLLSWAFIYKNVLSTYDLIYPVMSQIRNLHDKNVVDAMAEQLKFAISLDSFASTLHMPMTRELSAGKRKLLERYVDLLPDRVPPDPT